MGYLMIVYLNELKIGERFSLSLFLSFFFSLPLLPFSIFLMIIKLTFLLRDMFVWSMNFVAMISEIAN